MLGKRSKVTSPLARQGSADPGADLWDLPIPAEQEKESMVERLLSPRWRKVLRDVAHNKMRTALVVISIAVGVMAIGVISGARTILQRELQAAFLATNPHHAILFTEPFDYELVQVLRKLPAVAEAEGRREVTVRLQTGPDQWQKLKLTAIADFNDMHMDTIQREAGAWPPPRRMLLLERASLAYLGLHIGDTVPIQLPNGQEQKLRVAGQVHDINQPPTIFSGEVHGYIALDTLELLGWPPTFDQLLITVNEQQNSRRHILAVTDEVKEKVERSGRAVYGQFVPAPGEHWSHTDTQSMIFLLTVLGVLALCLSGFLVINTISAVLLEQIRQIGVMKAMGARRRQLIGLYLGAVGVYGLLALVIAIPVGALGAVALTRYVAGLLNFDVTGFPLTPTVLALEIAAGLLTPLLAALLPVLKGTRITVHEAINAYGLGRGHFGQNWMDHLLNVVRGLPRPLLLSLRNTFRRKGRLLLVVATLTLASAIFIGVLSVRTSLARTLDDALRYWQYDVSLQFGRPYRQALLVHEANNVPGIVEAEGWGFRPVVRMRTATEESDNLLMIAPPVGTRLIDPILLEGRWLRPDDGKAVVINTDLLQEEPDLRVGDELVLKIDEQESRWQIVGLVKQPLSGPFVYVNYPVFARAVGEVGRVNNLRVVATRHDGASQAMMAQALEAHFEGRGFQVVSTRTTTQERAETENALNIVVVFLLIMAMLLAVVGGLGLMGVMSINVLERTREIGVLRAIGASNSAVMQIVITEGMLIGLLSWLLGALLAWPLGQLLSDQVGQLFLGTPATYTFAADGAWLWLSVMLLIAGLASFLPARNATRLTVHETLAYQ